MTFADNGGIFPYALRKILDGTLNDFTSYTKKAMILTVAPDGSEDFVSDLTEFSGTNYTGGYGGSGRKTLSGSFTWGVNAAGDGLQRVTVSYGSQVVWSSLGTAGDAIRGICIITEITNDAASIPLIWIPFNGEYDLDGGTQTLTLPTYLFQIDPNGS